MDLPATQVEPVPEKEKIEDGTEGGPAFHCDLDDSEIVRKIAQGFLSGLSAACVDNTTGDIFRSPGSVAADIRKEMIDYLVQRSESFVAESVILESSPAIDVSDHPFDIISDIVDDFASSKRNLFSRVSGWLMSEKREDKIDDFIQEMEMNAFWLMDKREEIAQTMVKNVDVKNSFHCDQKFNTADELAEHVANCGFRTLNCTNEGCSVQFSAKDMAKHDSVCPFKIIPCEQKCSDYIMRRGMDKHCITVCPMKLMNCPFYSVGCESSIPQYKIQQHLSDNLHSHLLYALENIHKGISAEDLKKRAEQMAESSSENLARAKDVGSLTIKVKNLEVDLVTVDVNDDEKAGEESNMAPENVTEESMEASENAIEGSTQTLKNIGEESTKGQQNVCEISVEAPKNDNEKSAQALKDVGEKDVSEESTKAPRNATEEIVGEEFPKDLKDDSEESMEVALKNVSKESMEVALKNVSEESTKTSNNVNEESSQRIKNLPKEAGETPQNVSK